MAGPCCSPSLGARGNPCDVCGAVTTNERRTTFVIVGQRATASEDFLLDDVPGTSGRLDVLLRCLRAALLCSHGLRRDVVVYLVLLGGQEGASREDELAPRTMRVDGASVRFLRPDERALAVLTRKVLATRGESRVDFTEIKPGVALVHDGFDAVLRDHARQERDGRTSKVYVLDEGAADIRDVMKLTSEDDSMLFVIGDHLGVPADVLAKLDAIGATRVSIGPISLHADDAVAVVHNEVDRQRAQTSLRGA